MLVILLNGKSIEIDEKTTIGLTIGTYNVSNPATPTITISNNFSIPKTAKNLAAIGFAGSAYYFSNAPYEPIEVLIFNKNDILLYKAKARIEAINDRIELLIYQKNNYWDEIKLLKIKDNISEFLAFLNANRISNKYTGTFEGFLSKYSDATSGIILPYTFSNLYPDTEIIGTQVYKKQGEEVYSAHCFVYLNDIFRFLENKYHTSFGRNDENPGNLFNDAYFQNAIVFLPFLIIKNNGGFYFEVAQGEELANQKDAGKDLTFYDVIDAAFKIFNVVMDYGYFNGEFGYRFYRFDKILEHAPIIDWSGKISEIKEFRPLLENINQQNNIVYKALPKEFPATYAGKTIICNNKNLNAVGNILVIPAYAFGFVNDSGAYIPNLSQSEAYNNVTIAILSSLKMSILAKHDNLATNVELYVPNLYDLSGEYEVLESIYTYPQQWTIEKWLDINDIVNFRNFTIYYVDILGASFIVGKIDNFSLTSKTSTKVTLIKISDVTIKKGIETSFWVDGVSNIFVDGQGNGFEFVLN